MRSLCSIARRLVPVIAPLVVLVVASSTAAAASCANAVDFIDPTYGGVIRQLLKPDGHEHNIYYHRNPWNADNSRMIGIQSDLLEQNWRVVLYDGQGCYLKDLFVVSTFDWRLVWDRHDPAILYTFMGGKLFKIDVDTGTSVLLKSFAPLGLKPTGLSLNQAGDRILVVTSDGVFRSYHLPDMTDPRSFATVYPEACVSSWKSERYIGFGNYVATSCTSIDGAVQAIVIYDDSGTLLHQFDGIGGGGHYDFSPNGKLAYLRYSPFEIHVVDIEGTDDTIVFSAPESALKYLRSLHLSWPDRVPGWFIASFFPSASATPPLYAPVLDEIVQIYVTGEHRYLARSETVPVAFWAQPLASPSADGSRVNFNSNRSGTIDQFILFVPTGPSGPRTPGPPPPGPKPRSKPNP